ncbi:MAG TPA: CpsB/CapC family capsule biosynthesis tyrosine phosphatase [Bryobacteraceae bacterium]|nr:CpsB/CapC family capsule biosynthesis tyrosine phosphatase [Bryobacteraceae bacterium]
MVDIHSHILWGMDDGAPTEEVSLEMLRLAAAAGTTDIVATPHSNGEFEYQPELIAERIRDLTAKTGGTPRIHRGCDFHLSFDNIEQAMETPGRFSINGKRYLLVEFADLHIPHSANRILEQLLGVDLVPIITHPERNPIIRKEPEKLNAWIDQGCLVQVTALSVLGGFGKSAEAAAHQYLSKGMVHFIASDAHDPVHRHPKLDEAYAAIAQDWDQDLAELLLVRNPGKAIRGEYIEDGKLPVAVKRPWWQFWG